MCKCTPNIRTPYCGKGDCVWPNQKKEKRKKELKTFDDWYDALLFVNSDRGEFGLQYPMGSCCFRDIVRDKKVKEAMREVWVEKGLDVE